MWTEVKVKELSHAKVPFLILDRLVLTQLLGNKLCYLLKVFFQPPQSHLYCLFDKITVHSSFKIPFIKMYKRMCDNVAEVSQPVVEKKVLSQQNVLHSKSTVNSVLNWGLLIFLFSLYQHGGILTPFYI